MAKISFRVGDDGRHWFKFGALEGHVDESIKTEHPVEYAKFKAQLEAEAQAVAEAVADVAPVSDDEGGEG